MCTVSFVPSDQGIVITSSRDEHYLRLPALPPDSYVVNDVRLTFPKDSQAGGTWFAVRQDTASVMVLLNGAFEKHIYNPPYRKSRGLILLDLITNAHDPNIWDTLDLDDIEPFTIIYCVEQSLEQWAWDGKQKHRILLPSDIPHIWSSSTLYEKNIRIERKIWFEEFLTNVEITPENLLRFHKGTKLDDRENGLIIRRSNGVRTQSITQAILKNHSCIMTYENLADSAVYHEKA